MKVLYVGHYREASGWGQAARDYILAMDSVGIDVVPRSINISGDFKISGRLLELEKKSNKNCDICIQHVLPHYMMYNGNFKKNIALFVYEALYYPYLKWVNYLNLMDEIWVPNKELRDNLTINGIKIKTQHIVPHAVDVSKFNKKLDKLDIPQLRGNYVFYFIGEFQRRKNIKALLEAFHAEFLPSEPVALLLKTSIPGASAHQCATKVIELCQLVKNNLRLYPTIEDYKREVIIAEKISEDDLYKIHNTCDCFVMPSFGEACCIPAMDAIGFGNDIIANNVGGLKDLVSNYFPYNETIGNKKSPTTGMHSTLPFLSTGLETWQEIDITDLMRNMRKSYSNKRDKKPCNLEYNSYSYVGNLIKDVL